MQLTVTEAAQAHFRTLLQAEEKKEDASLNLRIYASHPGTAQAEIGVTFCPMGDEEKEDIRMSFQGFDIFIDKDSETALQAAKIDFVDSETEGEQLSIKAPNLKGRVPASDSPLSDRVRYVLDAEISPTLAGHGGKVSLVDIINNEIVVLQFGGGCHGCGMANVTLKHGIEKTLKEKFPEITEVRDATDHALGENPYY